MKWSEMVTFTNKTEAVIYALAWVCGLSSFVAMGFDHDDLAIVLILAGIGFGLITTYRMIRRVL